VHICLETEIGSSIVNKPEISLQIKKIDNEFVGVRWVCCGVGISCFVNASDDLRKKIGGPARKFSKGNFRILFV
jgi:hypothetical protein